LNEINNLTKRGSNQILNEVISQRFKAIFTCVRRTWFDEEWLGCKLDEDHIERLKALNDKYGIDLCREKGNTTPW